MSKIKNFKNDKEMIQYAAEGCYYPHNDHREFAMVLVIERLVLPEGVDDYGLEDMAEFIRLALINTPLGFADEYDEKDSEDAEALLNKKPITYISPNWRPWRIK